MARTKSGLPGIFNTSVITLSDEDGAALALDSSGRIILGAPGTGALDLAKLEDAVHASGDAGVMSLVVRNDTLASLVGADGDYAPLQVDANGGLYITGDIAHDAADSGNAVKVGAKAINALPTDVANNDRTDIYSTLTGALNITTSTPGAGAVLAVRETISNTTTRATAATPTGGKRIRVISVIINYDSTTATAAEVYFDTGTNISSDETKAIAEAFMVSPDVRQVSFVWPDGGGPVGAADDVLSVREGTGVTATLSFVIHYREE